MNKVTCLVRLMLLLWLLASCADAAEPPATRIAGKSLAEWQTLLKDQDVETRRKAAVALGQPGTAAAVRPLREVLLNDNEAAVRFAAAESLGKIGPPAAPALANLADLALDEDELLTVRVACAVALGRIGVTPRLTVPVLYRCLKTPVLRTGALEGLALLGKDAAPAFQAAFKESDRELRSEAARELARIARPENAAVAALLVIALQDEHPDVRHHALHGLSKASPAGRVAMPQIIAMLPKMEGLQRMALIELIGRLAPYAEDAVPLLIPYLKSDADARVRGKTAETLGYIRSAAVRPAVPDIIAVARDANPEAAELAVRALGELGPDCPEAVPALVGLLGGPQRERAMFALAAIGTDAVPELVKALKAPAPKARATAAGTLMQIGGSAVAAAPALVAAVKDPDPEVRTAAIWALVPMRAAARAAVPELLAILKGPPNPNAPYLYTGLALQAIGVEGEDVNQLVALSTSPSAQVRAAVAAALGGGGPAGAEALKTLARDGDDAVRAMVTNSQEYSQLKQSATAALPRFQSKDPGARRQAALVLVRFDFAMPGVVHELLAALGDPSPDLRRQAADRLGRIPHNGRLKREVYAALLAASSAETVPEVRKIMIGSLMGVDGYRAFNSGIRAETP